MVNAANTTKRSSLATSMLQNTIAGAVGLHGLSLFHGYPVSAQVLPAPPNSGIVFRRTDLNGAPDIPATVSFLRQEPRRTVIGHDSTVVVETIEHLMAALAGLQIDNAIVELDAPEVPSFDGSCIHFCDALMDAGIVQQNVPAKVVRIRSTATLSESEDAVAGQQNTIRMTPGLPDEFTVTYHLDYGNNAPLKPQSAHVSMSPETFYSEIARARTFVLESEIQALQSMGYGNHLTTDDLVVVGKNGIIDNQLHWENEGARHKILDCVGDLALSGSRVAGSFEAWQSGHKMNHEVAKRIQEIATSGNFKQRQRPAA